MKIDPKYWIKDLLHYPMVFIGISVVWYVAMIFVEQFWLVWAISLCAFIPIDKLAHKIMGLK